VFEAPTPAALAESLAARSSRVNCLPPLLPGRAETTAPLSAAQRRAWLFERMHPDSIAYQFAAIFRFEGDLDQAALKDAFAAMIRRHEILRTSFVERNGEPLQVIHPERSPRFETVDLRQSRHDTWPRLIRARVRTRIDAGEAPLMRSTLARLGEHRWELLHVEHHMIHDGWSFTILADELAELYSARVEDRKPDLPPLPVQFQDYASWEAEARRGNALRRQIEHWIERVDPDPPLIDLPGARARPGKESFKGGSTSDVGSTTSWRADCVDSRGTTGSPCSWSRWPPSSLSCIGIRGATTSRSGLAWRTGATPTPNE
jgi:hypothetical protein